MLRSILMLLDLEMPLKSKKKIKNWGLSWEGPGRGLEGAGVLFGPPVWPKILRIRPGVFFHAAFVFEASRPQNTIQKSKNKEKLNL